MSDLVELMDWPPFLAAYPEVLAARDERFYRRHSREASQQEVLSALDAYLDSSPGALDLLPRDLWHRLISYEWNVGPVHSVESFLKDATEYYFGWFLAKTNSPQELFEMMNVEVYDPDDAEHENFFDCPGAAEAVFETAENVSGINHEGQWYWWWSS